MQLSAEADCRGDWPARSRRSYLDVSAVRRRNVAGLRARAPAPKNGVAKPGPRAETPQPTTARTRTLARKRRCRFDPSFMTRRLSGGNSSGPDLRGDWGVETEAGALRAATGWVATARNSRLAQKQPPGHLRFPRRPQRGDRRRQHLHPDAKHVAGAKTYAGARSATRGLSH